MREDDLYRVTVRSPTRKVAMEELTHLLMISLDTQRFALPLASIERVIRAVELTPLPESPPHILGVLNVQGRIIIAVNIRRRCHMPDRDVNPGDQIVIINTARGPAAIVVDRAEVITCGDQARGASNDVLPGSDFVLGVIKRADGLILVCEPDALIALPKARDNSAAPMQARMLEGSPTLRIEQE